MRSHDNRRYVRYSLQGELSGYILESDDEEERSFQATIHDISESGLGVLSSQSVKTFTLIQCQVKLAGLPCSIPTLAQVCWVKSTPTGERFGLQFLL